MKSFSKCFAAAIFLLAITTNVFAQYDGKREWRAVWIATVNNIDWPSKPGLTSSEQQKELIQYLDLFKSLNFNAIILQIRPTADAFYKSELEPWSIYLTGDQSVSPDQDYDPLEFAIRETHKRGMEFHAWLNPYRVSQDTSNLKNIADYHIAKKQPELFVKYGKKYYFDPAYPQTREFLCKVIKDIVTRYDVDGIHFDDYFYPNNDFDDSASFAKYSRGFAKEDKMAWRRDNVDLVVKMLRDTIKSIKPYVKFGISPYAVWRNKKEDPRGSDSKSYSYTNYDHLHADILKWMQNGWVDYILPQLYFNIGYENADFDILSQWWADNSSNTTLYAGLASYRLEEKAKIPAWRSAKEIDLQIDRIRSNPKYQGSCFFNAKNMKDNLLDINSVLKRSYSNPALIPQLPGFSTIPPSIPMGAYIKAGSNKLYLSWSSDKSSENKSLAYYYAIYRFKRGDKIDFNNGKALISITGETSLTIDKMEGSYIYYITALDRLHNESKPVKFIKR